MRALPVALVTPLVFWACGGGGAQDGGADRARDGGSLLDAALADTGFDVDGGSAEDGGAAPDGGVAPCRYPAGAAEPMTLGGVLWPYRWAEAFDPEGQQRHLDLAEVHCAGAETEWRRFDHLLFVSIPAW